MAETGFVNYTPYMGLSPTKDSLRDYFANNPSDSNEFMDRYLTQPDIVPDKSVITEKEASPYNLSDILSKVNYFSLTNKPPSQKMTHYSDIIPTKTPKEFLERYEKMATDSSKQTGISKDLILAQLALESGWGEHINQNNIGNIKPGAGWKGNRQTLMTTEYDPKKGYSKLNQEFRAYNTPEEGFKDYASFLISNARYKPVIGIEDPYKAAEVMAKTGYATDPQYAEKLKNIITKIKEYKI